MNLHDILKKIKNSFHKEQVSIFDDEEYPYTEEKFLNQKGCYNSLSEVQKAAIIAFMGYFRRYHIPNNTYEGECVDDLIHRREALIGITFNDATQHISAVKDLYHILFSIERSLSTDYLLTDMKFILKQVVSTSMLHPYGAETNRKALQTLIDLFVPMGYTNEEVFNHGSYMHIQYKNS